MHDDLFNYLSSEDDILSLFPGGIHHMSLPQNVSEWPAMAFQQVAQSEFAEDMEAPNDEKIDQVNYQFAITSNKSQNVIASGTAFTAIFRNFRGTMGATRIQTISVGNIAHVEERLGDKLRRRVVLDFQIFIDA